MKEEIKLVISGKLFLRRIGDDGYNYDIIDGREGNESLDSILEDFNGREIRLSIETLDKKEKE